MDQIITIEVAYALPEKQYLLVEQVTQGTTVGEALKTSKLLKEFPNLSLDKVGIFAQLVTMDTVLKDGDRIEVYRPLKADPRDRRRQKVQKERSEAKT